MHTEYEVRILDIDVAAVVSNLKLLGAKHKLKREMKRCVYDIAQVDGIKDRWMRLRDNGEKIELTIKEIHSDTIDGTKETEIEVKDFEMTRLLLSKLGFIEKAYQENKRSSWTIDGVDIEIDSWPKIPSYLEIEGPNIEKVQKIVEKLGFSIGETTAIGVKDIYTHYGFDIHDFKELKF